MASYLRTCGGLYVAWPQAMPGHPYGDWTYVQIEVAQRPRGRSRRGDWVPKLNINPVRALTMTEVCRIKNLPYYLAGFKVFDQPWAVVAAVASRCDDQLTMVENVSTLAPRFQIGV